MKPQVKNLWQGMLVMLGSLATGSAFGNDSGITPEMTARWWQWAISIPSSVHPLTEKTTIDATGEKYCMVGQQGEDWFLGGVFKTVDISPTNTRLQARRTQSTANGVTVPVEIKRKCAVIPLGKSILIPVLNGECSTAEELALGNSVPADLYAKTRYLRHCAKTQADAIVPPGGGKNGARAYFGPSNALGSWMGRPISIEVKRVYTVVPFSVTFSPDNIFSRDCGPKPTEPYLCSPSPNPSLAQADGYWARVRPQKAGTYAVETFGAAPSFDDFALRVKYVVKVVAPKDQ